MILLNDDDIYVGQIKQLLHSFELPRCPVYDPTVSYIKGQHYIKDGAAWVVSDGDGNAKEVSLYAFGDRVDGITGTLPISSAIYDSNTHAYLGNYLRFLRDFAGVDLMGLYNCNAYDMPSSLTASCAINVGSDGAAGVSFSTDDSGYSLIMVPVRWGKRYTVAVDWHGAFEMACIHYSNGSALDDEMISESYHREVGPRFNHPFLYEMPQCPKEGDAKESALKLILKVPSSCNSSIVVLEGDFRKCAMDNMYMADNTNDGLRLGDALCWHAQRYGKISENVLIGESILSDEQGESWGNSYVQCAGGDILIGDSRLVFDDRLWNFDYVTKSQLLSMNLGSKALLADRLVEYLSLQAISPMDEVVDNIKRLQKTLNAKYDGYSIKSYGKWDESMRRTLYSYAWTSGLIHRKEDMLAYFDKDVEKEIGGLASKHRDLSKASSTFVQDTIGGR